MINHFCIPHYKIQNKHLIILIVLLIFLFSIFQPLSTFCADEKIFKISSDLDQTVVKELDNIDFSCLNDIVVEFNENNVNLFSIDSIKNKVYSIISGENALSYSNVIACLFSNLVAMIIRYLPMLSVIIAIGVISNLLNGIKSKFNEKSTSNLIDLVCFISVCVLIIASVMSLVKNTTKAINSMVEQMNIVFPILLTLMVAVGSNATAGAFQPIVAIMSTYVADIFRYYITPLFMISFAFSIISNLSTNVKLDKFSSFIASMFKWSVGIIFTLFFAVFTIQGITAGSFDSLSIRTTKYTIKSYVPVMGGYLADGMDLILSSTILIKNSVGLVGIFMIISTIISPLIEIVVFSLLLKLLSAVLQPMGNSKLSNFLTSTSKTITILSTSLIAIGFMYLISTGLVITGSNVVI